jgi:BirA family biotin operon repressor/biotin-[acetyl-CoA-carboxylase] ligase
MQNYENFSKKINTLFVGKDFRYLPTCQSTNQYALELIQQDDYFEGTTVLTDCQTAGRGQQGNTWEAEPLQNLTLSVILTPHFLHVQNQFDLSIATTLAIHDLLSGLVPDASLLEIKWSNDLLYNRKKICGILIQNVVSGNFIGKSVVGIGLNVNQTHFTYPQATSLSQITGLVYDLSAIAQRLLENLEKRYLQLKQSNITANLKTAYYQRLYGYQKKIWLENKSKIFEGKVLGIDTLGRLLVEIATEIKAFDFKEIKFLLDRV